METYIDTSSLVKRESPVTKELQALIDLAAEEGKTLLFPKGTYLIGPLFFRSHSHVLFEKGATFLGSEKEEDYPLIDTRIAGIEMKGYPGIFNLIDVKDVVLEGEGTINGQGKRWYIKYWGEDQKGGMRKEYDARGIRWACDYDCLRPKNILIQNSKDIRIDSLTLLSSPFWNLHVLYSNGITLKSLKILSEDPNSPSTDGIDIDSSFEVLIKGCIISTNDDGISIKSGRDSDGLRVNKPSHDIRIENCLFQRGYGLSIGSELSGGIYDISGRNLRFEGSSCAFRIKSSRSRKGYVKDIHLSNILIHNTQYPFYLYLDWNPLYNKNILPKDFIGEIPPHYKKLLEPVKESLKDTEVSDLCFENVQVSSSPSYTIPTTLFTFSGFPSSPIKDVVFKCLNATISEYGSFKYCEEPNLRFCNIKVTSNYQSVPGSFDNR